MWVTVEECVPQGLFGTLKYYVIGWWKKPPNPFLTTKEIEEWEKVVWRLKESLMVAFLRKDLLFLEFVDPEDAKWVIKAGNRSFGGNPLQLGWWNPDVGCVKRKDLIKEIWMRVVGLPLHLWTGEILKKIRDSCEGFIAIDKQTGSGQRFFGQRSWSK